MHAEGASPEMDNSLAEEMFMQLESGSLFVTFHGMSLNSTGAEELFFVNVLPP